MNEREKEVGVAASLLGSFLKREAVFFPKPSAADMRPIKCSLKLIYMY
jgi:hypothetical protein